VTGAAGLLAVLQHGDSFFPSGSLAFSWGLETLRNDGLIRNAEDVEWFVVDQLRHRWATMDRPVLVAAHRAADDLESVVAVDRLVEAMSLAREARDGSRRAGTALLSVHQNLGTVGALAYQERIKARRAWGHLAVVQGLVWRGAGLDETAASAVSGHTLCVGLLGAALRLGAIGHIDSQRSLARLGNEIDKLSATPAPALEDIGVCTPETDIAAMRHETESTRLFIT
jgi:urease accessory protein